MTRPKITPAKKLTTAEKWAVADYKTKKRLEGEDEFQEGLMKTLGSVVPPSIGPRRVYVTNLPPLNKIGAARENPGYSGGGIGPYPPRGGPGGGFPPASGPFYGGGGGSSGGPPPNSTPGSPAIDRVKVVLSPKGKENQPPAIVTRHPITHRVTVTDAENIREDGKRFVGPAAVAPPKPSLPNPVFNVLKTGVPTPHLGPAEASRSVIHPTTGEIIPKTFGENLSQATVDSHHLYGTPIANPPIKVNHLPVRSPPVLRVRQGPIPNNVVVGENMVSGKRTILAVPNRPRPMNVDHNIKEPIFKTSAPSPNADRIPQVLGKRKREPHLEPTEQPNKKMRTFTMIDPLGNHPAPTVTGKRRREDTDMTEEILRRHAQLTRGPEQRLRNLAQSTRSDEQRLRNLAQASRSDEQRLRNVAQASRSEEQRLRNLVQASRSPQQKLKNETEHLRRLAQASRKRRE